MPTNLYFNNYSAAVISEQRVLEDLIVESIKIMGHDCYYIPRSAYDYADDIYGEIVNSKFSSAYVIEAYLANVQGFEGDGDFFSKFGLEVRTTSNFIISRRSFERIVPSTIASRPREGDLFFVPVLHKLFEIKFIEEELNFFSLGKRDPYIYEMRCEPFRFSNEDIDTGVEEIDVIEDRNSYTMQMLLGDVSGIFRKDDIVFQGANLAYASARAEVRSFYTGNNVIQVINIKGNFTTNVDITGTVSGATANLVSKDASADYVLNDEYENKDIQQEADDVLVIEFNPFGTL